MDISLRQLEAFIKVAEHRSFSKAGDELFLSQSTISSHVAQLEESGLLPDRQENRLFTV